MPNPKSALPLGVVILTEKNSSNESFTGTALSTLPVDEAALVIASRLSPHLDIKAANETLCHLASEAKKTSIANALDSYRGRDQELLATSENNLLPRTLELKKGLPIMLATVWSGVARRCGMSVEGICFPGHFLMKVEGEIVDPVSGRKLTNRMIEQLLFQVYGRHMQVSDSMLEASSNASIIERILRNLQRSYDQHGDNARSLIVSDHLFELTGSDDARRDRGLHAAALGAHASAASDLRAYLKVNPEAEDTQYLQQVLDHCSENIVFN